MTPQTNPQLSRYPARSSPANHLSPSLPSFSTSQRRRRASTSIPQTSSFHQAHRIFDRLPSFVYSLLLRPSTSPLPFPLSSPSPLPLPLLLHFLTLIDERHVRWHGVGMEFRMPVLDDESLLPPFTSESRGIVSLFLLLTSSSFLPLPSTVPLPLPSLRMYSLNQQRNTGATSTRTSRSVHHQEVLCCHTRPWASHSRRNDYVARGAMITWHATQDNASQRNKVNKKVQGCGSIYSASCIFLYISSTHSLLPSYISTTLAFTLAFFFLLISSSFLFLFLFSFL